MKNIKEKDILKQISSSNINFISAARSLKPKLIDTPEQAKAVGRKMAVDVSKKLKLKLKV